jgi:hypothetical protein
MNTAGTGATGVIIPPEVREYMHSSKSSLENKFVDEENGRSIMMRRWRGRKTGIPLQVFCLEEDQGLFLLLLLPLLLLGEVILRREERDQRGILSVAERGGINRPIHGAINTVLSPDPSYYSLSFPFTFIRSPFLIESLWRHWSWMTFTPAA